MAGLVMSKCVRAKDEGPIQITADFSGSRSASTSLAFSLVVAEGLVVPDARQQTASLPEAEGAEEQQPPLVVVLDAQYAEADVDACGGAGSSSRGS